jgi:hypothetical protein
MYNWEFEWDSLSYYLKVQQAQNHLQVRLTFSQLPGVLGFTPAQLQNPGWWMDIGFHMDEARRKKQEKARKKNKRAKPSWRIADLDVARQSVCFVCD